MSENLFNNRTEVVNFITSFTGVQLSTSAVVNGIVRNDIIVVHSASPRALREIVTKFKLVSLQADGIHIPVEKWKPFEN